MLTVGIHEEVNLGDKTAINEMGSLDIQLVQGASETALDALMSDEDGYDAGNESNIKIFVPSVYKYGSSDVRSVTDIVQDIKRISGALKAILKVYLTEDVINKSFGTKIIFTENKISDNKALEDFITVEDNLKLVVTKLFQQFVDLCGKHKIINSDSKFRIKLIRQSEAKHWPTFPKQNFETFVESMEVSKEQSKVAFTKYELENKLDSPVKKEATSTNPLEAANADNAFTPPVDDSINEVFVPEN